MYTCRSRIACSHDKCVCNAAVRRRQKLSACQSMSSKRIAATSMIVHCSSPQCAIPAVATSLVLIAGMCKFFAWAATAVPQAAAPYLPSVAPCPVRPVQRRRREARCLPGQALAPRRLLLLRRAHSKAVRACCCIVTLRQLLRSAPDAVAYTTEGVLPLLCSTAG